MALEQTIKQLPTSPGIYQYFDKDGHLLYVGKAKNLARRVKSYFNFTPKLKANPNSSPRIIKMINQAISLNYIVVNSEHDALILENSLIKQLNPKYNILLRDDKTYPYIYIDKSQEYPRFEISRKVIKSPDIEYFGPYSVGARDIIDSIYEICKLVQKKSCLKSKKACLYYQIDKCFAPCEFIVPKIKYRKEIDLAYKLIKNKNILIKKLGEKMLFYAENLRFEEAGEIRDRIDRINRSQIKSDIDFASNENYDIFVITASKTRAVVVRIFMRYGKIISSSHDFIQLNHGYDEDEIYKRALIEFYSSHKAPIVAPILLANNFNDINIVQEYLTTLFEKKANIQVPQRGKKKDLIDLALLNANELLKKDKKEDNRQLLNDIKTLFQLSKVPNRVEVFDNSHMAGVATVGAMIVYENAKFDRKSYRTYHLKAKDEYAQMRETLTRRVNSFSKNSPPDLWILDGGLTLLKLAHYILESNAIYLDVIAISKEKIDAKSHRAKGKANDIIHIYNESFKLQNSDKRLQWVQNLRDEAHRSAITFHKKTKLKLDKESKLLSISGISEIKIKKLLNHLGTFQAIKKAPIDELAIILNQKDAEIIANYYKTK